VGTITREGTVSMKITKSVNVDALIPAGVCGNCWCEENQIYSYSMSTRMHARCAMHEQELLDERFPWTDLD